MTDDVVARAKAAIDGVTAAPWRTEPGSEATDAAVFVEAGPSLFWCPDCGTNAEAGGREAEFIVAARLLIPELIGALQSSRAQLRDYLTCDGTCRYAAPQLRSHSHPKPQNPGVPVEEEQAP
jgi:hypothetical protein